MELKFVSSDTENDTDTSMTFSGYGAVFNNTDSYGDVIVKGAFKNSVKLAKKNGSWPAMLSQHGGWGVASDDFTPIGIWTDISEDEHGLKVEGKLADTVRGQEAYKLLKMTPRPAYTGLSIGYFPVKWTSGDGKKEPRRKLEEVELLEISLVTFPANDKARIESVKSGNIDKRYIEQILCDAGLSRMQAKRLIAEGYNAALGPCDEAKDAELELAELMERYTNLIKKATK